MLRRKILLSPGGTSMFLPYSAYELSTNAACPWTAVCAHDKERNLCTTASAPTSGTCTASASTRPPHNASPAPDGLYTSVYYFEGTNPTTEVLPHQCVRTEPPSAA